MFFDPVPLISQVKEDFFVVVIPTLLLLLLLLYFKDHWSLHVAPTEQSRIAQCLEDLGN